MANFEESVLLMTNKSSLVRGAILNDIIFIERLIDQYISNHFCSEKEKIKEFMEYVICQNYMSFDSKKQIFINILKNNNPDFYTKHKELLKSITGAIEDRNIIAHCMLDSSIKGVEHFMQTQEVSFLKIKNGSESVIFSQKKINDLTSKILKIRVMLEELGLIDLKGGI